MAPTLPPDGVETPRITALDIALSTFACLLCVFICTVNVLTIVAIAKTDSLRTVTNVYVASLAAADFAVGLGVSLLAMFLLPTVRVNVFYRYINLCVFMQGFDISMIIVSGIHMAYIAIERYLYIARPYAYTRIMTIRVVKTSIIFAWVFGIIYTFLPQFIYQPYGVEPVCDVTKTLPIGYLAYSTGTIFVLLVGIIMSMYCLILRVALKQNNAIRATTVSIATVFPESSKEGCGKRLSKRKFRNNYATIETSTLRSVKFFFTIMGTFFVCITPVIACMITDYFVNVQKNVYHVSNLLALANSGMNFIIFAVKNRQFRKAYIKILPNWITCHRCRPNDELL